MYMDGCAHNAPPCMRTTRKNEMVGWTDTGLIWWDSTTVLPVLHGTIGQDGQGFFRAVMCCNRRSRDIPGIPGYSGSSRVHSVRNTKYPGILGILPSCPPYIPPHRHSVRNTKYPGILGILPSCPPIPIST